MSKGKPHKVKPADTREVLFSVTTKDLVIDTFSAGGPGGQNQNKVASGVRIRHPESGAVGESREERSQLQNKRNALKRLVKTPQFLYWVDLKSRQITGHKSAEEWAEEQLADLTNLRVERKDEHGRWVEWDEA